MTNDSVFLTNNFNNEASSHMQSCQLPRYVTLAQAPATHTHAPNTSRAIITLPHDRRTLPQLAADQPVCLTREIDYTSYQLTKQRLITHLIKCHMIWCHTPCEKYGRAVIRKRIARLSYRLFRSLQSFTLAIVAYRACDLLQTP